MRASCIASLAVCFPRASSLPQARPPLGARAGRVKRLHRPREPDVVVDHRARPNRNPSRIRLVKSVEDDLVAPYLAEKIRKHVDRQLLAGATPIAEAEGRESGIVADRRRLPV